MIKRFKPSPQPDGIKTSWDLPSQYVGGPITVFINGQMVYSQNNTDDIFGYTLDEDNKIFEFYTPLEDGDFLYIMYDSDGSTEAASDFSGSGLMRLQHGFNLISYQGQKGAKWDKTNHNIIYDETILANIQNLFIDQIEDVYGVPANTLVREFQTFETDVGKYRTFNTSATSPCWVGDGSHVTDENLYRASINDGTEYGDPDDNDYISYTPNNFILSNCYIDGNGSVQSLDVDNDISDLAAGLRTGILVYIFPDADLSVTDNRLELWF